MGSKHKMDWGLGLHLQSSLSKKNARTENAFKRIKIEKSRNCKINDNSEFFLSIKKLKSHLFQKRNEFSLGSGLHHILSCSVFFYKSGMGGVLSLLSKEESRSFNFYFAEHTQALEILSQRRNQILTTDLHIARLLDAWWTYVVCTSEVLKQVNARRLMSAGQNFDLRCACVCVRCDSW